MLYARCVGLAKDVAYPINPFSSQATRSHPGKGPEWNNAVYEEKEKYHYFTHPAQKYTNSHPISTKEKKWGREKKKGPTPGARKSKQRDDKNAIIIRINDGFWSQKFF